MARAELTGLLRRIHAAYREAQAAGLPVDVVFERDAQRLSRRRFLRQAAGAGAALAAGAVWPLRAADKTSPRIAIVGGGLAGVVCAYRLMQAGLPSTIYEAGGGLGGRTWTLRGFFDEGQIAENGGEFISSEHVATRALARELDLPLDDLRAWDKQAHPGAEDVYYMHGQRYPIAEMLRDYASVYPALEKANAAAGTTTYDHHTPAGFALDHMSAREWIVRNVPGGIQSKIGWLLDIDTTTENGGDSTQQNALTLTNMLVFMPDYYKTSQFYLVGTDERYRVHGGNDQIVGRMAAKLPPSAQLDTRLQALSRRSDGSYACTFSAQQHTFEVVADHVVLALPFKTLRDCELSQAGFSSVKMKAITELPMGTNTKMHVQLKQRVWFAHSSNGATYSDTGYQQTWEDTRDQPGTAGVLVNYTGGIVGASWNTPSFAPAPPALVHAFLSQLEALYPGVGAQWNGKAFVDNWTKDRWHRGSYSYWGLGNCTSFVGIEQVPQGNVHFCGEHTSRDFQGFMNGAVETGEQAAREIIHDAV